MNIQKHTSEHEVCGTNIELHHYITEITPEELRELLLDNISKLSNINIIKDREGKYLTSQFGLLQLKFYTKDAWDEACPTTEVLCEITTAMANLPLEVINQINLELSDLKIVKSASNTKSILYLNIEYGVTGKTIINQIERNLDSVSKLTLHMFEGNRN
ncbi:hypothetical protein [Pseudoalteromonas spongiae]|uniref:hypothetical protein n=1 Tax=Pseudoalteromonas spongiae TaxID=298657 RepID=UPI000C2D0F11|nr:hypothetical protein [Pseudoalteromonas spongiae]